MVKNLPANAGDMGSIPGGGTKIPCVCVCVCARAWAQLLSHVRLFVTPLTVACQAPLFMEFSRQEHWSGLLLPSPGDLPNLGIKPKPPVLQADFLLSEYSTDHTHLGATQPRCHN